MPRLALLLLLFLPRCASNPDPATIRSLASHAHPITSAATDYDALMNAIGGSRLVLLGEATHGTHEFYAERARITQRLIAEKHFAALALEADWIDTSRVNAYVRGEGVDRNAAEALGGFTRFPRWMWRNVEFAELVEWIRRHNDAQPDASRKVSIYGLDLYGDDESQDFLAGNPPRRTPEERFAIEQSQRVVRNAAEYEREGALGRQSTWNIRDRHMIEMLRAVQNHLAQHRRNDRVIVWAHNSHVGDARATSRRRYGEWNIGQLARENWPAGATFIVGFTTESGTVVAADNWDSPPRVKTLRPSVRGSHGAILHAVGIPAFYLLLEDFEHEFIDEPRLQRAVGVIYRPATEYESHYFTATLAEQFDAVIHVDVTRALQPLDPMH